MTTPQDLNNKHLTGDAIVYLSAKKPDTIHYIKTVSTKFEYVVLDNADVVNFDSVRPASTMELAAKKRLNPMPDLANIEKREFELGLAPDDAYVKSGSDEQIYLERAFKAQGEVA